MAQPGHKKWRRCFESLGKKSFQNGVADSGKSDSENLWVTNAAGEQPFFVA